MSISALDREVAKHLYARGWGIRDIAQALDLNTTTVYRHVKPGAIEKDRQQSRRWKARNKHRTRQYDHDYHRRTRKPCPQCRQPMSADSTLCRACRAANAAARHSMIIGLYQDGMPLKEIAKTVGTTINSLSVTLNRLRATNQIGYRYNINANGQRIPRA